MTANERMLREALAELHDAYDPWANHGRNEREDALAKNRAMQRAREALRETQEPPVPLVGSVLGSFFLTGVDPQRLWMVG